MPPLSGRREDIPLLAIFFLQQLSDRYGKPLARLAPDAPESMLNASWPGNIRHPINVLERAVALSVSRVIRLAPLRETMQSEDDGLLPLDDARRRFEYDNLVRLLRMTHGNVSLAARAANRNRTDLYKLFRRHGIVPIDFKVIEQAPKSD